MYYNPTTMQAEYQDDLDAMSQQAKDHIAPLFYEGIRLILDLLRDYENQGYLDIRCQGSMIMLLTRLSTLRESPQQVIEDFIQEVSPLLHGVEYSTILQERLNMALNPQNEASG